MESLQGPKRHGKTPNGSPQIQNICSTTRILLKVPSSPLKRRWLTARELLVSMLFPCYQALQQIYLPVLSPSQMPPLCCFNVNRRARGYAGRQRNHMSHQAGNSMAITSIGAVVLWILGYVSPAPDASLPSSQPSTMCRTVGRAEPDG